jgi:ethanolamine ammonia-lyase small subunit
MARGDDDSLAAAEMPEIVRKIRARTPARLLAGRAGAAYRTNTQLELREAHAAARDAVGAELDLLSAFGAPFIERWALGELRTQAGTKQDYLLRPDLGRHFNEASRLELKARALRNVDLQIAIGDGLSVGAVMAQVPALLPLLEEGAKARGWTIGAPFVIHHCRVGILNEIGELLDPRVAVLLIGERPGLATAESLSAYMANRPRAGHTDADRNLVSNIHGRGLRWADAAGRILNLAAQIMKAGKSGVTLSDEKPALEESRRREGELPR